MHASNNTPEAARLGRNDSKNPSTTCRGITGTGRACRRALASRRSSPTTRESSIENSASEYCWQHQDQAAHSKPTRRSADLYPLQERTSIDTLVNRLGIHATPRKSERKGTTDHGAAPKPPRRTQAQDFATSNAPHAEKYNQNAPARHRSKARKPSFWASLCCIAGQEDDYVEIVRHRKRTQHQPEMTTATPRMPSNKPASRREPSSVPLAANGSQPPPTLPYRPAASRRPSHTHTDRLLSLIPSHLPPDTTSALLAELIKPLSPHDEEGYIYIFWLTPQARAAPPEETARSLLLSSSSTRDRDRRVSDAMTEFSFDGGDTASSKNKIMLKIGRANNVTRRMSEWQRQCGYALTLVRWYPYVPTPSLYPDLQPRKESVGVRKTPCVKRVERLIHLELASKQVKRQCESCGREHREWFEVEASRAGVGGVDEVVRRWVGWAEGQGV